MKTQYPATLCHTYTQYRLNYEQTARICCTRTKKWLYLMNKLDHAVATRAVSSLQTKWKLRTSLKERVYSMTTHCTVTLRTATHDPSLLADNVGTPNRRPTLSANDVGRHFDVMLLADNVGTPNTWPTLSANNVGHHFDVMLWADTVSWQWRVVCQG